MGVSVYLQESGNAKVCRHEAPTVSTGCCRLCGHGECVAIV